MDNKNHVPPKSGKDIKGGSGGPVGRQHPGRVLREAMDDHCVMMPGSFNGLVGRAVA